MVLIRSYALAGMVAPLLFISLFALEGWLRPGYNANRMFVSELSLGTRGWVQITNFVLTGLLVMLFAYGVHLQFPQRRRPWAGALLLGIIGFSLIASGPFRTDPSALFNQISTHGLIHGLFGAVVFSLAPVSCFVSFNRFRQDPAWRPLARLTLLIGLVLVITIALLKSSQFPQSPMYDWKGLIQRVFLVTFLAWIFVFAQRVWRLSRSDVRGGIRVE
ncbi:DUF998 domain-containing protein [Deinococcus alpinitundrae]|uniref:DUF998 domain-containing protein n=1 Tax=Deinococcus alpinitundrae TaxID=468913 RepID=UPI00137AC20C|nr:DUF998 domain-containing protein [Deinococcus alpinitundrae]